MGWLDKAREIHDSLPNVSENHIALTTTTMITPQEAKRYLDKNIYGLSCDVHKYIGFRKKIADGSLGEAEDVVAVDTKGALVGGATLLHAIIDEGVPVVHVVSTDVNWKDDPRDFSICATEWIKKNQ